jgi:hypothetical protein
VRIDVNIDVSSLLLRLEKGEKRLAYAAVNAINKTAVRIQAAEHEHVREAFIIRKPTFFFGTAGRPGGVAARITPFASVKQSRPYAEIAASAPSGASARRTLLPQFEHGGIRKPMTPGAKSVAVPLLGRPARPSIRGGVPPEFTFPGMHLVAFKGGKRLRRRRRGRTVDVGQFGEFGKLQPSVEGVQYKGRNRTFQLPKTKKAPRGGVFQRIGPGRGDIREIWSFITPPELDNRLHFQDTARRIADRWFREELQREAVDALSRSRPA